MSDRFILKWVVGDDRLSMPYSTQHDALQKASELFHEHGPDLEIELHLTRLSPPPSILFNTQWMRDWNRRGRPAGARMTPATGNFTRTSPTTSLLPPAIAVAQSSPSLPSICDQARGLR